MRLNEKVTASGATFRAQDKGNGNNDSVTLHSHTHRHKKSGMRQQGAQRTESGDAMTDESAREGNCLALFLSYVSILCNCVFAAFTRVLTSTSTF